jgi:hypothetical protein
MGQVSQRKTRNYARIWRCLLKSKSPSFKKLNVLSEQRLRKCLCKPAIIWVSVLGGGGVNPPRFTFEFLG